jgi:acyl-CoA dehydrogenase
MATDELQSLLADTCTRLFTDRVTPALIESTEKGKWPDELWQAVEEGGLTLPQIPEQHGGAGGTWDHAQVVLNAAGRFAVPLPIAETMVGAWLLSSAGLDVPMGPITVAPTQAGERLALRRDGAAWTLSGTAARVPWGAIPSRGPARRWLPPAPPTASSRIPSGWPGPWPAPRRWRAGSNSSSRSR